MKLSHAIMMNGITKPQGFGNSSIANLNQPCAIGGALQVIGRQSSFTAENYSLFRKAWPWTENYQNCPACAYGYTAAVHVIFHLNDNHEWTRAQIAEWVATIEPKDIEQTEDQCPTTVITAPQDAVGVR